MEPSEVKGENEAFQLSSNPNPYAPPTVAEPPLDDSTTDQGQSTAEKYLDRPEYVSTERSIRSIAMFSMFCGFGGCTSVVSSIVARPIRSLTLREAGMFAAVFAVGTIFVFCGFKLYRFHNWARIAFSIFMLVCTIMTLVLLVALVVQGEYRGSFGATTFCLLLLALQFVLTEKKSKVVCSSEYRDAIANAKSSRASK